MTITTERTDRPAPVLPRVTTTALAWAEARRMRYSLFLWGGVLLAIALGTVWGWTRMPTWDTFHENAGMSTLVLAAAVLITAHLDTGRDRRAGAEESTRTTPTGPGRRSLAMAVTVPIAAMAGVLIYVVELLLLLPAWPVGQFDPWMALTVVVIPAIGAAIGVVVGRVLPGAAAGPLSVVALSVLLTVLLALQNRSGAIGSHLFPVLFSYWDFGVPRPVGWHLLYLAGILVAVIAMAVWPASPKVTALIALTGVVFAGFSVHREAVGTPDVIVLDDVSKFTAPEALDCRTYDGVRYCALPGYAPWITEWRGAVEPVAELLPASAQKPSVRQIASSDSMKPMTPGYPEMVIGDTWGRTGSWAQDSRIGMIRVYAATSVGLRKRDDFEYWRSCEGTGQHRTVVALWLLAQAVPGEGLTVPWVRYGPAEIEAVESLLAMPTGEVSAYLAAHWSEVLDPSSTALAGLGVTITPRPVPAASAPTSEGEALTGDRGVCP